MVFFALGSVFSIHEGIDKLRHPHVIASPAIDDLESKIRRQTPIARVIYVEPGVTRSVSA